MKRYAKSRTFWLIFLAGFVAVIGVTMGIYIYELQDDLKKERQASRAENLNSIGEIHAYVEEVCKEATVLASRLQSMEWVQKIAPESEVFEEELDYRRRMQIANDFLFYTAQSDIMSKRFLVFPYRNICVGRGVWADAESYFGTLNIPKEERKALLLAISAHNKPFSIETGPEKKDILVCIPIEKYIAPRAYLCSGLDPEKLIKNVRQMMSEGVRGLRISHAADGSVLLETGDCRTGKNIVRYEKESNYIDWKYEFFEDEQTVIVKYSMDELRPVRRVVVMALVCLVIAWILAMLLYRPVMKLMKRAGIREEGAHYGRDDYKAIERHICEITDQYHHERRLALLHQLLSGYFEQEEELLRSAGIEISGDNCFQVILCAEKPGLTNERRGESRMALEEYYREQNMKCEMIDTLHGELVILMIGRDEADIRRVLLQSLRDRLQEEYSVFAGDPIRGLVGVSLSYQMARERCQRMTGLRPSKFYLPIEWELQLIDALLKGRNQVAMGICAELRRENERRLQSGKFHRHDYDCLLSTLLSDFSRVFGENGGWENEALTELTRAYQQENAEDFWAGVQNLIGCRQEKESARDDSENVMRRVSEYIDENYANHDMSMQMICEAFSMSANTVNKCVKTATGLTFYAYLTQRRMEKAKALLAAGISVADVAVRVGYDTDYSFRRAFQRYTGVKAQAYTPADEETGQE